MSNRALSAPNEGQVASPSWVIARAFLFYAQIALDKDKNVGVIVQRSGARTQESNLIVEGIVKTAHIAMIFPPKCSFVKHFETVTFALLHRILKSFLVE